MDLREIVDPYMWSVLDRFSSHAVKKYKELFPSSSPISFPCAFLLFISLDLTHFLGGQADGVDIAGDGNCLPGRFLTLLTGSLPAVPAASVVDFMRLGEERLPLRDLSFWERHLPWPVLAVPQNIPEINSEPPLIVGRELAFVC